MGSQLGRATRRRSLVEGTVLSVPARPVDELWSADAVPRLRCTGAGFVAGSEPSRRDKLDGSDPQKGGQGMPQTLPQTPFPVCR